MVASILKLAVKFGLAGGAVYWTVQQGFWGTAEDGAEAGKKFTRSVMPSAGQYLDKIPSYAKVNESAIKNWNAGIKASFSAISQAPETAADYVRKAKTAVSEVSKKD